ncbi:MAG: tRNA lysidine(34) synthetase TilS [Verrucomicrobiota bacterium]
MAKTKIFIPELEKRLLAHVDTLKKIKALSLNRPLACCVSGGMDSMVMLESCLRHQVPIHVFHFNHRWRGKASDADADFIRQTCEKWKIPLTMGEACTVGPTSEGEARDARWKFFLQSAAELNIAALCTAHHADDQVETFLLQLLRGAGPEGLASLTHEKKREGILILRPLLPFTKAELEAVAHHWKLKWKEDKTNKSPKFFRNRVRLKLMPYLDKISGRIQWPIIQRTCLLLAEENDYWEKLLPDEMPQRPKVKDLSRQHPAFQRRYLRKWLHSQGIGAPDFEQIEAIRRLLNKDNPAKINLSKNRHCRRRAGFLFLE